MKVLDKLETLRSTVSGTITLLCMRLAMRCNFDMFTRLAITATARVMRHDGAFRMEVSEDGEGATSIRFLVRAGDEPRPKTTTEWVEEWEQAAKHAPAGPTIH